MAKKKGNRPVPVAPVPQNGPPRNPEAPASHDPGVRYRFYAARMDDKVRELDRSQQRADASAEALRELLRDANSNLKAMRAERDALRAEIVNANETIEAVRKALEFLAREEISDVLKEELALQMGVVSKALEERQREAAQSVIDSFDRLSDLLRGVTDAKGRKRTDPTIDEIVMGVVADKIGLLPGAEKLASDDPPPGLGG